MVSLVDNLINVYDQYNKVYLADDKKGFLNKHWLTANGEIKTKTLGQRILARLCFTRKSFKEKNNISFKKLQGKLFEEFKDVTTHEQVLKMAKCLSIFETFREKKRYTASKKFTDKVVSGVIHKQMTSIISYLKLILL